MACGRVGAQSMLWRVSKRLTRREDLASRSNFTRRSTLTSRSTLRLWILEEPATATLRPQGGEARVRMRVGRWDGRTTSAAVYERDYGRGTCTSGGLGTVQGGREASPSSGGGV